MVKLSNTDVVNKLMPNALLKGDKMSFRTIGSYYKPIAINVDPGDSKSYNVTTFAKVTSNGHSSKAITTYKVICGDNGEIKQVNILAGALDD